VNDPRRNVGQLGIEGRLGLAKSTVRAITTASEYTRIGVQTRFLNNERESRVGYERSSGVLFSRLFWDAPFAVKRTIRPAHGCHLAASLRRQQTRSHNGAESPVGFGLFLDQPYFFIGEDASTGL
jgi:hypothetical protein